MNLYNNLAALNDIALSGHQSVKKAGVKQQARPTHVLVDSSSDESADDNIEQSVEQPSIVIASLVVGSLIVVPLSVALVITVCARLHKQGSTVVMSTFYSFYVAFVTTGTTKMKNKTYHVDWRSSNDEYYDI